MAWWWLWYNRYQYEVYLFYKDCSYALFIRLVRTVSIRSIRPKCKFGRVKGVLGRFLGRCGLGQCLDLKPPKSLKPTNPPTMLHFKRIIHCGHLWLLLITKWHYDRAFCCFLLCITANQITFFCPYATLVLRCILLYTCLRNFVFFSMYVSMYEILRCVN